MTSSSHEPGPGKDKRPKIPGVVAAEIERAFHEGACDVPVADRDVLAEFFASVLTYVQDWYSRQPDGSNVNGIVAFVFSRRPRTEVPPAIPDAEFVRFFTMQKDRPLAGKVYFAAAGVKDAREWSGAGDEAGTIAESLVTRGFGDNPAVLIDLSTRQATLCHAGVDAELSTIEYQIPRPTEDLSVEVLDSFLTAFHEAFLNPNQDQALKVWASRDDGVPKANIEKLIQTELLMAARLHFGGVCAAIPEVPTRAGRIDVIVQPWGATVECGVLLELKALRSRASVKNEHTATAADFKATTKYYDAYNEEAVVDAIDQANYYRTIVKAAVAFVCCYDLRTDNGPALVDACLSLARARNVELRHYPVFRDAKHWRQAQPDSAHAEWKKNRSRGASSAPAGSDGDEADE